MKNKKFIKYSSAIGALLAVSGGAHAVIQPGNIMPGIDGDIILNHNDDYVFIDIDNDNVPDFIAWLGSYSVSYTFSSNSFPTHILERFIEFSATSSFFMENAITYSSSSSFINFFVKNNQQNDVIGPIDNLRYSGFISWFTDPSSVFPFPFFPDFDGVNGDDGYIGVGMTTPDGTNYGWIHVNIGPGCMPVIFDTCVMEHTANMPIAAGNSLPVPILPIASAAGLGIIGLMAALKKRKKVTE